MGDGAGVSRRRPLRGVGVAAVEHDTGALLGEQFGHREADAAGAADDDGALAGQRSR